MRGEVLFDMLLEGTSSNNRVTSEKLQSSSAQRVYEHRTFVEVIISGAEEGPKYSPDLSCGRKFEAVRKKLIWYRTGRFLWQPL